MNGVGYGVGLVKDLVIPLLPGDRVFNYYDTQALVNSTTTYHFFPANPTRAVDANNYKSNPLQTDQQRVIVGFGMEITVATISSTLASGSFGIADDLAYGTVQLLLGQQDKVIFEESIQRFIYAAGINVALGTTAAASSDFSVLLRSHGIQPLNHQVALAENEFFDIVLTLDAAGFPSTPSIKAILQVAEGKDIVDRIKQASR